MINLLPPKEKEALQQERQKKLVVLLAGILGIALVCLVLVLLCLKFYILEEIATQRWLAETTERRYGSTDAISLKKTIEQYNHQVGTMDRFYKTQIKASDSLIALLEISRPDGIALESINMQQDASTKKVTIALSGTSNTRDNLTIFKENLEKAPGVSNVYFPPESWIKPLSVDFTVTLTMQASHEQ